MEQFLKELASLLAKHDASIFYTKDDDGIHFKVGTQEMTTHLSDNPQQDIETLLAELATPPATEMTNISNAKPCLSLATRTNEDHAESDNHLAQAIKGQMANDISEAQVKAGRVNAMLEHDYKETQTDG